MIVDPKKTPCLPVPPGRQDLTGQRFTRLAVIGFVDVRRRASFWLCICDCGNHVVTDTTSLKSKATQSCGCYRHDRTLEAVTKHGMSRKAGRALGYESWSGIIQRTTNPRNHKYPDYGGRGITVCDRWRDFANFIADMGPRPSSRHSIDRIDNDGNYEPSNCRWALPEVQARNKRRQRDVLRSDGVRFATIREAADASDLKFNLVERRLAGEKGWHPEREKYQFTQVPRLKAPPHDHH